MTNESQWMGAPGWPESVPTPARPEGETPPCQCGHALNQHLLAGGHCEQRGCACRLFVIPLPPARERGEEDDPEISQVVDRIALHASGRNGDCVDNTQCNAELDRATERAIEIVTRLTARLAELERERETCNGSCDIALARRQVGPDGVVPGNARECAELWEREAVRVGKERAAARAEAARLREAVRPLLSEVHEALYNTCQGSMCCPNGCLADKVEDALRALAGQEGA